KEWSLTRKVIALMPDVLLISLADVMKSMGHAGVRTAMKYRHPEMKTVTKMQHSRKCEPAIVFKLLILLASPERFETPGLLIHSQGNKTRNPTKAHVDN